MRPIPVTVASVVSAVVIGGTLTTVIVFGAPTRQHVTGAMPAAGACHVAHDLTRSDLPDRTCTPGATDPQVTQATIGKTICVRGYTAKVRPVVSETDAAKRRLMAAYGVQGTNELDHLVPLELGGSSDAHNLWPEAGDIPNPKDKVENALHALVCAPGKRLSLALAQRLIATDWTTATSIALTSLQ